MQDPCNLSSPIFIKTWWMRGERLLHSTTPLYSSSFLRFLNQSPDKRGAASNSGSLNCETRTSAQRNSHIRNRLPRADARAQLKLHSQPAIASLPANCEAKIQPAESRHLTCEKTTRPTHASQLRHASENGASCAGRKTGEGQLSSPKAGTQRPRLISPSYGGDDEARSAF